MRALLILILASSIGCGSGSRKENQPAGSPDIAAVADTAALFVQRCATCHGSSGNLSLGGAPRLTLSLLPRDEVIRQIRLGKGDMPPFGEMLSEEEIGALADFSIALRHTNQAAPTPDKP